MEKRVRSLVWLALIAVGSYLVKRLREGKAVGRVLSEAQKAMGGTRTMSAIEYFKRTLGPTAQAVERETGISARLGMIQAALESNIGTSGLSSPAVKMVVKPGGALGPARNVFGFKTGTAWLTAKRPYVEMMTTDYDAQGKAFKSLQPFRAYGTWDESYRDWARLMQTKMYVDDGALAALKAGDLDALGVALGKHYAPNQNYGKRLKMVDPSIGEIV